MRSLFRALAALVLLTAALPAHAAVTMIFWSHELGQTFPHAFVTLRGTPDRGGPPVDTNYGFTAKSVSPAILFGPVPGRMEVLKSDYIDSSTAHFSVLLTDAQYADILALVAAWSDDKGYGVYRLASHNCVHFVKEVAHRVGLVDLDRPKLMKKPRSYLNAIGVANAGRVTRIDLHGKAYRATLAAGVTG